LGKDSHDTGKISSGKHWVARKSCHAIIDLHSVKIALAGKEYKIDEEKSKGHKWHNMVSITRNLLTKAVRAQNIQGHHKAYFLGALSSA